MWEGTAWTRALAADAARCREAGDDPPSVAGENLVMWDGEAQRWNRDASLARKHLVMPTALDEALHRPAHLVRGINEGNRPYALDAAIFFEFRALIERSRGRRQYFDDHGRTGEQLGLGQLFPRRLITIDGDVGIADIQRVAQSAG